MLTNIWRFLFVPKQWTIIKEEVIEKRDEYQWYGRKIRCGRLYILQDQYGNIKEKRIMV